MPSPKLSHSTFPQQEISSVPFSIFSSPLSTPQVPPPQREHGPAASTDPQTSGTARLTGSSVVGDSGAGVAEARSSADERASAFPQTPIVSDAKKLFLEFVSRYLGVKVFGIQAGFKNTPDTYLFEGPFGTSMHVPTSVMLLDQASAIAVIKEKLFAKREAFAKGAA